MSSGGDWTAQWAAKKLREHKHVSDVTVLAPGVLHVERDGMSSVRVATLANPRIGHTALAALLATDPRPDFVLNLQATWSLTTEALHLSIDKQLPVGRLGDLNRALSLPKVREYVDPETRFRERGLEQHARVATFRRLDFNRYLIERHGLSTLTVVFLNDYDLSAEALRQARSEYGAFDVVVASNPNGRITDAAMEVAKQLGCEVLKWAPFLSRLHREHNQS